MKALITSGDSSIGNHSINSELAEDYEYTGRECFWNDNAREINATNPVPVFWHQKNESYLKKRYFFYGPF